MIIVISGPGGVGKGTVVARLIDDDPQLWLSRSWTTRGRRPSEDADAYVFVDRAAFEQHIRDDGFLEYAEFLGNLYGTPFPEPQPGQDMVLEIDVQGAEQIRARYPEALLIFMAAPSPEVQRERLIGRGDAPERVAERLDRSAGEAERARTLGATFVVNDELDGTVEIVKGIIDRARRSGAA